MERIDIWLVNNGYFDSRTKAARAVKEGKVKIDGAQVSKSTLVETDNQQITVENQEGYVSVGAEKLKLVIEHFQIDINGKICLDVGSSTGGFTDYLLQNEVYEVTCVDVGTNQLHPKLRASNKVVLFENTDIRNFYPDDAPHATYEIIVTDVSFISLSKVLDAILKFCAAGTQLFFLIKPQFEIGKEMIHKKGIIKNKQQQQEALDRICALLERNGCKVQGTVSTEPLIVERKNIEYMLYAIYG